MTDNRECILNVRIQCTYAIAIYFQGIHERAKQRKCSVSAEATVGNQRKLHAEMTRNVRKLALYVTKARRSERNCAMLHLCKVLTRTSSEVSEYHATLYTLFMDFI